MKERDEGKRIGRKGEGERGEWKREVEGKEGGRRERGGGE